MYCILWVIFQILAVVVEGGVSSGSNEALANNNAGAVAAAGNGANAVAQNGIPLIGEPVLARLVQLVFYPAFFIQPAINPADQALLQQLIPIPALQQGVTFDLGQAVGLSTRNLQGQVAQQAGGGGPATLLAVLPQNNAGIDPQLTALTPGQVQMMLMAGANNQRLLVGAGGNPRGRGRLQRSVATRLRRTQSPLMKAEADEEEEESSGMESAEKLLKLSTAPTNVMI